MKRKILTKKWMLMFLLSYGEKMCVSQSLSTKCSSFLMHISNSWYFCAFLCLVTTTGFFFYELAKEDNKQRANVGATVGFFFFFSFYPPLIYKNIV